MEPINTETPPAETTNQDQVDAVQAQIDADKANRPIPFDRPTMFAALEAAVQTDPAYAALAYAITMSNGAGANLEARIYTLSLLVEDLQKQVVALTPAEPGQPQVDPSTEETAPISLEQAITEATDGQ